MPKLRIIEDTSRGPAFNMAADLYLLKKCVTDRIVYVRMYRWKPATITIGYMQDPDTLLDEVACTKDSIAWIRRPTGGRAVLHKEDLTYSCIFSKSMSDRMGNTVSESYRIISSCLMAGLARVGIDCLPHDSVLDSQEVRKQVKLPCFLAPNRDEIMVGGKKLVGSAQKRTAEAVLQHGSIPITGAFRSLPLYQRATDDERQTMMKLLKRKCTSIEEIIGDIEPERITAGLKRGFIETLGMEYEDQSWTCEEEKSISDTADSEEFRRSWLD